MIFLLCDTQFHFGAVGRWTGFLLTFSPLLGGIALALPALLARITDASMARRIERSCPGSRNVLINAVQFDEELAAGSAVRAALFEEMHDPFPQVQWREVFNLPLLKKLALTLSVICFAISLLAIARPGHFINSALRIFLPASPIEPLTRTRILALMPGDTMVAHGDGVNLTVTLGGEIPKAAWVSFCQDGSTWQRMLLDRDVGRPEYSFAWKEVREPVEYYVEAGDVRSVTHRISVQPRTVIKTRSAEIQPPAYTKLPSIDLKDFEMLRDIIPGSRFAVALEFTSAVTAVHSDDGKGGELTVTRLDETHWRIAGTVIASQTVKVKYRDTAGHEDADSLQMTVKPDEAPRINVTAPEEGREIVVTPDAELPLQFTATAGFGLGSLAVYKSTNDKPDALLVKEWKDAVDRKSFVGGTQISLRQYAAPGDDHVTFSVIARDRNDVTGPGVTISRPIVVSLRSDEKLRQQADDANAHLRHSLEELVTLQQTNLNETRTVVVAENQTPQMFAPLIERQAKIADIAGQVIQSGNVATPEILSDLRSLVEKEMKDAVLALRNAGGTEGDPRAKFSALAISLEAAIFARLQGGPAAADAGAEKGRIQDLLASVDELLREQRDILRETNTSSSPGQVSEKISGRQDALAEQSVRVRTEIDAGARNAALGDQNFRTRLAKVSSMFTDFRIYPDMLGAADKLESRKFSDAATTEKGVVDGLAKIVEYLNQWQLGKAAETADAIKKEAAALKGKLDQLAAIQREIVEKSKELAHKNEFRPEDQAEAREIQQSKDLMAQVVEQMLTDAHIFPDLKPSNELRSELTEIYEDVIQSDKQDVAEGKLRPQDIAVQKEDGLLQAIEQAKKIADDMEMWLPNANETTKWQLENFDKTEIPDIPNLPLPDAFEDVVGKLLDEQQGLADQVQDAASNQAMAQNAANGWEIRDGPQPGFGAQGKSGNERPNKNEQTGRSSGGREGMSSGEMVGDRASNLEGTKPDVRRTNDPMQQGHVRDDGGISSTRATGGGKAGGFSDRNGMDGNAPLRVSNAPAMAANDALAVKQALLAEKTSQHYAQASLLYLRANGMADVARLMDDSQVAIKEGRVRDFEDLHKEIVAKLNSVESEIQSSDVLILPAENGAGAGEKQLLGGDEGAPPERYRKQVADYYRSLTGEQ